jgi:hypothetical protein
MSQETKFYLFSCPHCQGGVQVLHDELRCHIFRHGRLKAGTCEQMDPHTPRAECDRLAAQDLIYGCGKPFRVTYDAAGVPRAVVCDYI